MPYPRRRNGICSLSLAESASADGPSLTILQPLPGGDRSGGQDVTPDGRFIVGFSQDVADYLKPVRWDRATGFAPEDMDPARVGGSSVATGVSDDGQTAALIYTRSWPTWSASGGLAAITFDGGVEAREISADGSRTALVVNPNRGHGSTFPVYHAGYLERTTGVIHALPAGLYCAPVCAGDKAWGISRDGKTVVGYADISVSADGLLNDSIAIAWQEGPTGFTPIVLGELVPGDGSFAQGVSSDGQYVTGSSALPGNNPRGFIWSAQTGMEPLLPIAEPDPSGTGWRCVGTGVTDDGNTVVGYCWGFGPGTFGFLWRRGIGIQSFETYVAELGVSDPGFYKYAQSISPDGRFIAGQTSQGLAFILDTVPSCANGEDDDLDGRIDTADYGCSSATDTSERSASYVCDDGLDNDGDSLTDFPFDPGCAHSRGKKENPACNDGVDNDNDTFTDYPADTYCTSASASAESAPAGTGYGCGIGPELALALPLLAALRRRARGTANRAKPSPRGAD